MIRLAVCSIILIACIAAMNYGLRAASSAMGFWPFIIVGVPVGIAIVAASFAFDARERRRSQALQPPTRHDYR